MTSSVLEPAIPNSTSSGDFGARPSGKISPAPSERLAYIDTLRGFAALWVLLTHVHGYWLNEIRPRGLNVTHAVTFFAGMGGLGVDLFIVLSGFCLFYPVVARPSAPFDAATFFRRRAFRLLPPYYMALLFAAGLALVPSLQALLVSRPITPSDFVTHLFLVQTFSNVHTGSINGSFWSIALEAQLYVAFPLLLIVHRKRGIGGLLLTGLASAIAWQLFCAFLVRRHIGHSFNPDLHLPARWIEFIAGMTAAAWIVRRRPSVQASWIFAATLPITIVSHTGAAHLHVVATISAAATFSALVVMLARLPSRLFEERKPVALLTGFGAISYSFYLLHQPLLLLSAPLVRSLHPSPIAGFAIGLCVAWPLIAFAAYAFHRWIERPAQQAGKLPLRLVWKRALPQPR